MFGAEIWKISEFLSEKCSVFGGEFFNIFEQACFCNVWWTGSQAIFIRSYGEAISVIYHRIRLSAKLTKCPQIALNHLTYQLLIPRLYSTLDLYWPDRIPVGPITAWYRFKQIASRVWCYVIWFSITKTHLYNFDPLKPHFYIVKLGFTGVYIIFLISAQKHRLWVLVRTASPRRF